MNLLACCVVWLVGWGQIESARGLWDRCDVKVFGSEATKVQRTLTWISPIQCHGVEGWLAVAEPYVIVWSGVLAGQ